MTRWLGVEAVDEAPSLCQGNICLRRCTKGGTYFGVEREYQNAIEDENQLDEGILFLASKGKRIRNVASQFHFNSGSKDFDGFRKASS